MQRHFCSDQTVSAEGNLLECAQSLTIHQLISSLETVAQRSVSISLAHEQFLNEIAHADSARIYFLPKNNQIAGEFHRAQWG